MDFAAVRALVRLRHELRAARVDGRRDDARVIIDQMRALAERDPDEAAEVGAELARWQACMGL